MKYEMVCKVIDCFRKYSYSNFYKSRSLNLLYVIFVLSVSKGKGSGRLLL